MKAETSPEGFTLQCTVCPSTSSDHGDNPDWHHAAKWVERHLRCGIKEAKG